MATNDESKKPEIGDIAAGRTLDEQIEYVRKYGSHGVASVLRGRVLESLGIPKPRARASNLLIMGCYIPFSYGHMLQTYIKLFGRLQVDYTYLEDEFCCGIPLIGGSAAERKKVTSVSKEFVRANIAMARQKGAARLAYCCVGCAHTGKGLFPEEAGDHVYALDLVMERLKDRKLSLPVPTVVGYFEGCHSHYRAVFPDARLNWEAYRRLLDRIKNLRVVDLPHEACCRKHPEATVAAAQEQNIDTLLCACNGCYHRIRAAARGSLQVRHLAEMVLESLGRT